MVRQQVDARTRRQRRESLALPTFHLTEEDERRKLELVVRVATEVWGTAE